MLVRSNRKSLWDLGHELTCQQLLHRIEDLLQIVELEMGLQDLSFGVDHHLPRDVSLCGKHLCDWSESHCYPLALRFDLPLPGWQLLQSCQLRVFSLVLAAVLGV